MIELRPYSQLGGGQHGWLDTRHHFSFADYHDPRRMNWGRLRVWNDDLIAPHSGFPPHPHRDMEIITYVRRGAISHRDSLGNEGRTTAGDVQVMSAGTGIIHSEFNREDEPTQIFQIWIQPTERGLPPAWDTRPFPKADRSGAFTTLASGLPGDSGALPIRADARLAAVTLGPGESAEYRLAAARKAYLVPASGRIEVNGVLASAGDGMAIAADREDELLLQISASDASEVVLVEVA